eukprot:m.110602 g.110602  ORF g.110602 m.110602 type:complete len:420 (+) comp9225_c0_seq4:451-1710(+)
MTVKIVVFALLVLSSLVMGKVTQKKLNAQLADLLVTIRGEISSEVESLQTNLTLHSAEIESLRNTLALYRAEIELLQTNLTLQNNLFENAYVVVHFGNNNGTFYTVNPVTGFVEWTYNVGGAVRGSSAVGPDGTIYFGSDAGFFYAINKDGFLKWSINTGGFVRSNVVLSNDGTIYFGTEESEVYAVNNLGVIVWSVAMSSEVNGILLASDGTVFATSLTDVISIEPVSGAVNWQYHVPADIGSTVAFSPDESVVYVGGDNKLIYALATADGTVEWTYLTGHLTDNGLAVDAEGTIYAGNYDHQLYAITPEGTLKWTYLTQNYISAAPVIGSDGTIYLGAYDGHVYAFNNDGSTKWVVSVDSAIVSSPRIHPGNGDLYVGTLRGKVYKITPDGTSSILIETGFSVQGTPSFSMGCSCNS